MPNGTRPLTSAHAPRLHAILGGRTGPIPAGNRRKGINVFTPRHPHRGDLSAFFDARIPLSDHEYDRLFDILENNYADSEARGRAAIRISCEKMIYQEFLTAVQNAINFVSKKLDEPPSSLPPQQPEQNQSSNPFVFTIAFGIPQNPQTGAATKKGLQFLVAALYNAYGKVNDFHGRQKLLRRYDFTHDQIQNWICPRSG